MGYCTYTENKRTGGVVVAWIGTGTDVGRQVTVSYEKRARLANVSADKTLKCKDVREQFCRKYTGNSNCTIRSAGDRPSRGGGAPTTVTNPTNTGGNKTSEQKAKDDQYNKDKRDICSKECGNFFTDVGCYSAKWQYNCGGSTEFGDIIPDVCKDFPPPFNNCLLVGGAVLAVVLGIIILK